MTNPTSHRYTLPLEAQPLEILQPLDPLGSMRIEPAVHGQRTYFDTFDWRLHAAGSLMVEERAADGRAQVCWRKLEDDRLLGLTVGEVPRFVRDLASRELREQLEPLIEMRALLPVVQVSVVMHRVAVLNKQRKTVLRLVIEEGVAATPGQAAGQRLSPALRLEPVRGYRRPLLQARSILEEKLHLEPAECLLGDALRRIGRQVQDYSGKLKIALEPGQPTGAALRSILLHLLETMECNLEGTRADLDSEFLHDFRVAVRRTRSVFSQIKGVLPPQVLQRFRAEFKWLGQITGPTRDLDVYLLKLPAYRQSLPAGLQAELDPLQAYLEKHQREEQRKLARQLGSTRFRRLIRDWRQFLEDDCAATCWPAKASRPISQVADRQIWKTYNEVLREGDAISEDSPASALHELRITCKKLRYLIEFFQSLYPAGRIRKQIKNLKSLQDNLGDFHDLEVQAEAMKIFGHAMQREEHDLPGETFMAMGALIENLARRQVAERQNFADRFALFARPVNRKRCEQLFNRSAGDKEQL